MRIAFTLAVLGLTGASIAQQMPLPAFGSTFTAALTRGFWFQAPANATITSLAVPNEALQSFQVVEVIDFGTTAPTAWPTLTAGTQLFYDNASAAGSTISTAIPLVSGNFYGILGACTSAVGDPTSYNSYGTPAGVFMSDFLGIPTQIERFLTQSGIAANGGNQPCATETGGQIGRVEVTLIPSGGGTAAISQTIGSGCINSYASAYELTDSNTFGLNNTMVGIDFINTGAGYVMTPSAAAINPIGGLDPAAVAIPGVGDDAVIPVGTLGLEIGSNGWLATGAGNSNLWTPTAAVALNQAAAQFSCWSDLEPNAGGQIVYEELGTVARVTYDAVLSWGTTDTQTFQFEIDTATGNCSLYFGSITSATLHPMFIGYSPAGPNADPGSISIETELATNGAIVTAGADVAPLALASIGRPVQGPAAVNWEATTTNIEPTALFHIGIVGLNNPALPLSIIGFPAGCTLYAAADVLVGPAVVAGGSGSETWTIIGLPVANPIFNGFELYAQAATLDLSLVSPSARASNGVKGTIGDL